MRRQGPRGQWAPKPQKVGRIGAIGPQSPRGSFPWVRGGVALSGPLRMTWRIVWWTGSGKALQNQVCCGVAFDGLRKKSGEAAVSPHCVTV